MNIKASYLGGVGVLRYKNKQWFSARGYVDDGFSQRGERYEYRSYRGRPWANERMEGEFCSNFRLRRGI